MTVNVTRIEVHTDDPDRWVLGVLIAVHRQKRPPRWRPIKLWRWKRRRDKLEDQINEHDLAKAVERGSLLE